MATHIASYKISRAVSHCVYSSPQYDCLLQWQSRVVRSYLLSNHTSSCCAERIQVPGEFLEFVVTPVFPALLTIDKRVIYADI